MVKKKSLKKIGKSSRIGPEVLTDPDLADDTALLSEEV